MEMGAIETLLRKVRMALEESDAGIAERLLKITEATVREAWCVCHILVIVTAFTHAIAVRLHQCCE